MTICTTDYISRLGLLFIILPYQEGFIIKHPNGMILYKGKVAPDKFHYIEWDAFNKLFPVNLIQSQRGLQASDLEDYINDVCFELDAINSGLEGHTTTVNASARRKRNSHIPAEIVRILREVHVRYAHLNPEELAKVTANGARADIPLYTSAQVLKVMERWPCIYCRASSARIGSKGKGSGMKLQAVGQCSSVDNKDGYVPCLHWGFTGFHLFEDYFNGFLFAVGHKNHDASHLNVSIKELALYGMQVFWTYHQRDCIRRSQVVSRSQHLSNSSALN